mgnify:CR=1 FL=1|tara:strand:- start:5665 stop:6012 length:348 start_codon:yes stop_codon:yes gene_type:complete
MTSNSNSKSKTYNFSGKVWKYKGQAGWHFITLPKKLSIEIRKSHGNDEEGWGRLKTLAKIGGSEWKTAIWYDSKIDAYLLPVKSQIRKVEGIKLDSKIQVILQLEESHRMGLRFR